MHPSAKSWNGFGRNCLVCPENEGSRVRQHSLPAHKMLQNMLDGDGQDQYDSGGWCFPKPIPPSNKNDGQTRVLEPMMAQNTNEYFEENLREYPDENPLLWQKHVSHASASPACVRLGVVLIVFQTAHLYAEMALLREIHSCSPRSGSRSRAARSSRSASCTRRSAPRWFDQRMITR